MLNTTKTGLAFGLFFAAVHVVWSIVVALSWGQALIDFIWWAHMLEPMVTVMPFDFLASITVIILSFFVGFMVGNVFAHIYNKLSR